jgi:hypothetical protein
MPRINLTTLPSNIARVKLTLFVPEDVLPQYLEFRGAVGKLAGGYVVLHKIWPGRRQRLLLPRLVQTI